MTNKQKERNQYAHRAKLTLTLFGSEWAERGIDIFSDLLFHRISESTQMESEVYALEVESYGLLYFHHASSK